MDVVFSDVLFFVCKSFKRFDKSTILGTLSKFYHEDELCSAKSELCKYVAKLQSDALVTPDQATPTIDGWSKFVNSKGAPIVRKANEPGQRRRLEADDVLNMIMLLDVHKVELPKFVAEDLDRVPRDIVTADGTTDSLLAEVGKLVANVNQVLSQFTATMDTIIQRLDGVEAKLATPFTSMSQAVLQRLDDIENKISSMSTLPRVMPVGSTAVPYSSSSSVPSPASSSSSSSSLPTPGTELTVGNLSPTDDTGAAKSWADQARDLRAADPQQVFVRRKPIVRVWGKASNSTIKAVPRQLTCFVGRLHLDVTGEALATFLHQQGILDAQCKKMVAKNGRVFNTSAFKVTCSPQFESLFYDESKWPAGVELRDWIFYKKDGRH